ncbi:Histidine triad nucleotide-binding protein 3 [Chionoecetes opilio]|uniref:Adenosine 5'-monophosphoramidase HINT3 n=1 Tax=Chionoecetes opilio TaxID=41210 RepID=A0A8J4XZF3_CHIOP|nr:Histidine triad nucleotide-binding protein 3 [Chionoecetes opilio]
MGRLHSSALRLTDRVYRIVKVSARTMSASPPCESPQTQHVQRAKCLFCRICDGLEPSNIVHQDEEFVVFPDIRPAAPHHYLVLTREHITDAKCLTREHIPLVEKMTTLSKEVLVTQGGSPDTARLGFHWPPFHSISHLHLHIIAPESEMGLIGRAMFKSNSFWFVTPEKVIEQLQKKA